MEQMFVKHSLGEVRHRAPPQYKRLVFLTNHHHSHPTHSNNHQAARNSRSFYDLIPIPYYHTPPKTTEMSRTASYSASRSAPAPAPAARVLTTAEATALLRTQILLGPSTEHRSVALPAAHYARLAGIIHRENTLQRTLHRIPPAVVQDSPDERIRHTFRRKSYPVYSGPNMVEPLW
ncbi:hypothetical protein DFH09DRAFT_1325897 [Mycena vulgaris]|nr:hypothetical protein DFH09DRAFT_1325897 [Mycena vulgaris]